MQMFEDSGRLHAHHNRIKRGLPPGQSLSRELEQDCSQQELSREFRYSWLGLFNCWIGHNYPVPSSPPHAPRSGAHWPNRMEYFTPSPLETKLYWLFDKQSVLQEVVYSNSFGQWFNISSRTFHFRRLRNISFYRLHGIRTEMVVTIWTLYNRLFLEQHETHTNVFQLTWDNTMYYTN